MQDRGGRRGRNPAKESRKPGSQRDLATIEVERIAAGGSGIGRIDGMVCFVPRTAPGDRVGVAFHKRKRYAEGELVTLEEASPNRIEPRCRHYVRDRCGGCQLQHMNQRAQQEARASIVRDALRRIGKRDVPLPPVHAGGSAWGYRRRMTLTLMDCGAGGQSEVGGTSAHRGAAHDTGPRIVGGFHPYDDPGAVFDLAECPISHPLLVETRTRIKPLDILLPDADELRMSLRLGGGSDGNESVGASVAVVISGGSEWRAGEKYGEAVLECCPHVHSVWWLPTSGGRDAAGSDLRFERLVAARKGAASASGTLPSEGAASEDLLAFTQVNGEVAALLRNHVASAVRERRAGHVIDAYAGSGALTRMLLQQGVSVSSIELDPRAVAASAKLVGEMPEGPSPTVADSIVQVAPPTAPRSVPEGTSPTLAASLPQATSPEATGCVLQGALRNGAWAQLHCGRTEEVLPLLLATSGGRAVDAVVVNPPRRGLAPEVVSLLEESPGPRTIIYISCDPATLARDVSGLPSWRIARVDCFDMFPQTAHVETVCILERGEKVE